MRVGLAKARAAIDEFKPDFVVIWGDDQYENFKEDIVPPFSGGVRRHEHSTLGARVHVGDVLRVEG